MDENNRRTLIVVPNKYGLFEIHFQGGGQIPLPLKGVFTSQVYARKAIERYLKQRDG